MNIYDAAKILELSGNVNPAMSKKAYLKACKKYHPDINPAGDEMMKLVNSAYDAIKDYEGEIKDQQSDYGEAINNALNQVFGLSGLIIEICGAWLWITGDTKEHKDKLKQAGFKWASKKKAWYFRPEEYRSRSKGNSSLEEIREKYGSVKAYRNQNNNMISRVKN